MSLKVGMVRATVTFSSEVLQVLDKRFQLWGRQGDEYFLVINKKVTYYVPVLPGAGWEGEAKMGESVSSPGS